ncbi:hypothetical protein MKK30_07920 [Lactococcus formosensis]|uniref:hypothetical protein n=1 Tax=Lactococcus formosensis TaxID=1281486 RepID=UPI001F070C37|nr:hypothetical protein [Lactococcus formosensis]MCH1723563.1 hypothetical protein [Lactococcus formosensis]
MKILKKSVSQYIGNTGTENWPTSEMKADIDENSAFKLEMNLFNSKEFHSNETQREDIMDFMKQVLNKSKELADQTAVRYEEN